MSPISSILRCVAVSVVLVAAAFAVRSPAVDPEAITFPPHPRLAATAAEIAALKPARKDAAIAAAAPLLKEPAHVPNGPGDWVFYYACPDDGSTLNAVNETEHTCPKCKKTYTDGRTVAAYRTLLHDRVNLAALQLAWAYAFTGDERYAHEVRRILIKLADDYAGYPSRRDRWGRTGVLAFLGGRRYSQSLDEAVGVIPLAKAYDLTYAAACWDAASRKHVEADFFRPTAATLLTYNQGINNHQTWYNAGIISIASALGDAELVRKVLTMPGGFHDQLKHSLGDDGLWYEGAMAYHNYAVQAMIEIADVGRRIGLPLHQEPRFRKMIAAPLSCAYPNGVFPAINDSDPAHVSSFAPAFRWAWEAYRDPVFAQAYAGRNADRLQELLGPNAKPQPFLETRSVNLASSGLAILRHDVSDSATCAMLDYGPHGGSHGHYDKLNLVLFANEREWLLDPGRLTYSHKEYKTWVKHTAAHNTITINGRSQAAHTGKLLGFQPGDHFSACAAESDGAYPGVVLRRSLVLADRVLVDVFDVRAESSSQIDLLIHAISDRAEPVGKAGEPAPIVPGTQDGYPHLTNGKAWPADTPSRWEFVAGKRKLGVWLIGPTGERVITCTGIGYAVDDKVPCLIRRVTADHARFVSVYDLSGTGDYVRAVKADPGGWIVTTTAGRFRVTIHEKSATWVRVDRP